MTTRRALTFGLLASGALAACGQERKTASKDLLARVVCVSKQINEFIYAVGGESHLVARDLSSIYPPQIQKLPSVGYHRALSADGIISMRPSVFLTDGNVGPEPVLERLKSVGIPVVVMKPGESVEDAERLLTQVGTFFHRDEAAAKALADWKAGMDQLAAERERWTTKKPPRVLMMHFGQIFNNYLGIKPGSQADRMLTWAGGVNALAGDGKGMGRLTPEMIARAAPDIIVVTDLGFDRYGSAEKFKAVPGVALTPAAKNGRIYRIEETEVMYFGPRTPATVRKLHGMLTQA